MAIQKSNILLAAAALALGYFFDKKGTSNKNNQSTNFASNVDANNKSQDAQQTANKALVDASNVYESKVTITDITMQFFNSGYPHGSLIVHQFPYNYIVWAKFRNDTDIPVQIDITDVVCTILHTPNSKKLPINKNNFVIPAKTETKWLPIIVLAEQIINANKHFNDTVILQYIKAYFPRTYNFFIPAHFVVKYNVLIPSQDTILAKDVMYEADAEALLLPTGKGQSGLFGMSEEEWNKAFTQYHVGDFQWVEPVNRAYVHDSHGMRTKEENMLDPTDNPNYLTYLRILRDKDFKLYGGKYNYNGYPIRYKLLNNKEKITDIPKIRYAYYEYKGGNIEKKKAVTNMPYLGIVYDNNGYIAYE